jgi:hypothetical protein
MISGTIQSRTAWLGTNSFGTNEFFKANFDYEIELGYAFAGSSSQGSAAPGSGDVFGEASFGWAAIKIVQYNNELLSPIYTIGPEALLGFNSDSSYHRLHYNYGVGLAFAAGFPIDTNLDRPDLEFLARVGYARVDSMTYQANSDMMVNTNNDGDPAFSEKSALQIECEARIPIIAPGPFGKFGFLSLGGTFYKLYDNGPDTWTMYVAISIPLEKLLGAIPTPNLPSSQ